MKVFKTNTGSLGEMDKRERKREKKERERDREREGGGGGKRGIREEIIA